MSTEGEALNAGAVESNPRYGERKVRAVIVDDMSSMLDAICAVLELEGLVEIVGRAEDGAGALQAVARLNPELVLMDVRMPGMSGLDAAALLAQRFPETRVVLMSGEESPELREQCRTCGADGFVPKLDLAEELVPVLQDLFPEPDRPFTA